MYGIPTIFGIFLYNLLAPKPTDATFSQFEAKIKEAFTSSSEANKFDFIKAAPLEQTIYFRINGKDYVTGASSEEFKSLSL